MRMDEIKKLEREANLIVKQFEACQSYKKNKGIIEAATRSVDFYEGRQWGDFKGRLPFEKPTANIIQNIIDGKVASINQKIFKINFVVDNDQLNTNFVTKFAAFQMKEMDQEGLNLRASYDALIKGTGIWYYFWNEDKIGSLGALEGGVEAACVDINDIAVSNPCEKDIQKQEWIIIRSRESLNYIKEVCDTLLNDKEKDELLIKNDFNSPYSKDVEQQDEEMCDSYLKFFRQDGEVYFEYATKDILYKKAVSMNPLTVKEALKNEKKAGESDQAEEEAYVSEPVNRRTMESHRDNLTTEEAYKRKYKANQYPIVLLSFIERDNCIFGLSLVEQLIPTQKLINQLIATNVLTAVKTAMPTIVVKAGALGTANLDLSKPNGVITDYSGYGTTDAIKVLNTGTIPTTHYELAQSMISLTKDVYRANDILNDGRNIANGMSGVAITQLNSIRDTPIAQWQQMLSRAIAREGKILEMFYKLYYRNKRFSYELTDAELTEQRKLNPNADQNALTNSQAQIFNGTDYLDTPFHTTVEVGETSRYSELILSATLETLFLNGTISNLSTEDLMMYAELVPDYMFPKKNEFKQLLLQKQNSIVAQQQALIEQMQMQLEQQQMQQEALRTEFTDKVNTYNETIKKLSVLANQNKRMSSQASQSKKK